MSCCHQSAQHTGGALSCWWYYQPKATRNKPVVKQIACATHCSRGHAYPGDLRGVSVGCVRAYYSLWAFIKSLGRWSKEGVLTLSESGANSVIGYLNKSHQKRKDQLRIKLELVRKQQSFLLTQKWEGLVLCMAPWSRHTYEMCLTLSHFIMISQDLFLRVVFCERFLSSRITQMSCESQVNFWV